MSNKTPDERRRDTGAGPGHDAPIGGAKEWRPENREGGREGWARVDVPHHSAGRGAALVLDAVCAACYYVISSQTSDILLNANNPEMSFLSRSNGG